MSGCWRQQFDWAVVEWNRDNVFEHPALRNLPDGDLSGLRLTYEETRTNCIPMDSTTYRCDRTGRICASGRRIEGHENSLPGAAEGLCDAGGGSYTPADGHVRAAGNADGGRLYRTGVAGSALQLPGGAGRHAGDRGGGSWRDSSTRARDAMVDGDGDRQRRSRSPTTGEPGANGNRVGVYGTVSGRRNGVVGRRRGACSRAARRRERWRVDLDFGNLMDDRRQRRCRRPTSGRCAGPGRRICKLADFERSEFAVTVSNWPVTRNEPRVSGGGSGQPADRGRCSRRSRYTGSWVEERGNYSGGSIH